MSYAEHPEPISWADAVVNGVKQPEQNQFQQSSQALPTSSLVDHALTQAEGSLENALSCLWNLDVNRLVPSRDYTLDPQSNTRSTTHDAARAPLILQMSNSVWEKTTFACFKTLLDNYTADTGVPERVSQDERAEEEQFLDAICQTPCIQFAQRWLAENTSEDVSDMEHFKELLRDIWFRLYSRDASRDSSGFEHVFCGEIDDDKVKGLHNFIQVYIEEQRGNFDYKGYLNIYGDPSPETPPPGQQMLILRFEWLGCMKSVSSMFIGTSPEFEIALYSMLWLSRKSDIEVQLGPYTVRVKVYEMAGKIGSAFPELVDVDTSLLEAEVNTPATLVYNQEGSAAPVEEKPDIYGDGFPALG